MNQNYGEGFANSFTKTMTRTELPIGNWLADPAGINSLPLAVTLVANS